MALRPGRGRLSSIDLLPPSAATIVAWANDELGKRNRTQVDILTEFNARLADIGCGPISASAFNRKSVRLADYFRRKEQAREMAAAMGETRNPDDVDDLTLMLSEAIKTMISELLADAGESGMSTKETLEMARALQAAVGAETVSAKRRREVKREFDEKANKAIDQVAKIKGLSAEVVAQIRRDVLGVVTA